MGTCYSSKSSHDAGSPRNDSLKPKDKKKPKISGRNGYPLLVVLDPNSVQKDISDTVYTEDSHTMLGLEKDNLVTKSQQTSLELMTKDPNKNVETVTGCDKLGYGTCNTDNLVSGSNTYTCTTTNGVILTSDSGIVISDTAQNIDTPQRHESVSDSKHSEESTTGSKKQCNSGPRTVSSRPDSLPILPHLQTVCLCSNSDLTCSSADGAKTEHSCINEGGSRTTTESVEQLSDTVRNNESTADLDKIKHAIRQSSVTTPTEQRSFNDSFEFPAVFQQPEVTTMNMNGREVVVIDADLFTQIVDEIQFLKLKLRQLTRLIEDEGPDVNALNIDQPSDISPT